MFILKTVIFLAAFLMFQLELLMGKILLPNYGGSYMVWGACLVFFQATLLLGYLFSHLILQKIGLKRYRFVHLFLIFLPLLAFPGQALPIHYTLSQFPLVVDVFRQLVGTIGLVFFVLSTMSLVWQAWLAQSLLPGRTNPYSLFAVSNIGSFAGLLTYPLIFEAYLDLQSQQLLWRILYLVLIALQIWAFRNIQVAPQAQNESIKEKIRWGKEDGAVFLFAAAGVMIFMSVTNLITQEVVPMPLLWVMPLAVYLLSFFLVFKQKPWCPIWIENKIGLVIGFCILLFFLMWRRTFPFVIDLVFALGLLFHICMFCQSRLHQLKPNNIGRLTAYYLMIALGGFVGGITVSWVIPLFSLTLVEFFLSLVVLGAALLLSGEGQRLNSYNLRLILYVMALIFFWPVYFQKYNILGLYFLFTFWGVLFNQLRKNALSLTIVLLLIMTQASQLEVLWRQIPYLYRHRNYYGIYRVFDLQGIRHILNGTTLHGGQTQSSDLKERMAPLFYYMGDTPIAKILIDGQFKLENIGVIGLGAGALAGYTQAGQKLDYFELDPDVVTIAETYFTFLKEAPAQVNVIVGDARLSLKNIPAKHYDLLVIDAFGGDAIPVHLLTREVIARYHEIVKDNGLIVFHISNRYIALQNVIVRSAMDLGAHAGVGQIKGRKNMSLDTVWMAITWDEENFKKFPSLNLRPIPPKEVEGVHGWTDVYSHILPYLKLKNVLVDLKRFRLFRCE